MDEIKNNERKHQSFNRKEQEYETSLRYYIKTSNRNNHQEKSINLFIIINIVRINNEVSRKFERQEELKESFVLLSAVGADEIIRKVKNKMRSLSLD